MVALALAVSEISGVSWDSLQVKYAKNGGFWEMPLSVDVLKSKYPKFQFVDKDRELNVDLYSHSEDPRFFLLFDTYGNIAGIRVGYIKADIDLKAKLIGVSFPYNYGNIAMFKEGKFWKKDIWYSSALFVSPEKLKSGGRKDAKGVYVILDGKWVEVPKEECKVEKLGFTKQACYPGMGQHYFHNLTPSLDCKTYQPYFVLYEFGQLIGFGLTPFGSFTRNENGPEWFERLPPEEAKDVVPTAPQCAFDWYGKFGSSTLHIFLKKNARNISCPKGITAVPKC